MTKTAAPIMPSVSCLDIVEQRFLQRLLDRDVATINCNWEDVLIPQGMMEYYLVHQDEQVLDWVRRWVDFIPDSFVPASDRAKKIHGFILNDYCGNWGAPFVFAPLYEVLPEDSSMERIEKTCETMFEEGIRLQDGVFAHGGFAPTTVWVDTLYYSASPLAIAYRVTKNEKYAAEAIKQCLLHAQFLRDPTTGCFFHDANPETQVRTNWFWSRGNGWIIMALGDTLRNIPREFTGWDEVRSIYLSLCTGLLRYQHPSGMWRIIPELEESHLETSGTAMILTGLYIGINEGLLEPALAKHLERCYQELKTWIHPETGALKGSQKPAGVGGWETHKHSALAECTYASGIFLRLLAERKRIFDKT